MKVTRVFTVVVAVLAFSAAAQAQVRIPFQGVLELDGVLQDGVFDLKLTLYDAESGGSQVYTVTRTDVIVRGGYFSVYLGPLDQAQLDYPELFMALEVKPTAAANFTALQGRQRIAPAVYASRAAPGYAFHAVDIKATGTVTWACPPGTNRTGNQCITPAQEAAWYNQAFNRCHTAGMGLCAARILVQCDLGNHVTGTDECGTALDGDEWFWTSSFTLSNEATNGWVIHNNMAAYNGAICGESGCLRWQSNSGPIRYFCCSPVVPQVVLP